MSSTSASSSPPQERQPLIGRRRSSQFLSGSTRSKSFNVNDEYGHAYGSIATPDHGNDDSESESDHNQTRSETDIIDDANRAPTPLPKMQIFVLCVMRLSEPIAFLCILPFIPKMLRENMPDVPRSQIGYWAGLIESVFAIVQFATVFLWGRASDTIGRKPVLLIGLFGVALSMNFFGLAKTLPQMIIARSVSGFMNANMSVLKSTLGEITDETNQARAFSLLPLCFALGSLIGPALGGALSNPAKRFPIFEHSEFLKTYPYWLPCFSASLFCFLGFITGYFFLEETLPSKKRLKERQDRIENGEGERLLDEREEEEQLAKERPPPIRQLLTRPVVLALVNQGMINFINICYIAVLPLFCDTPLDLGGLSLNEVQIGTYLAANGCVTIIVQLMLFPYLERKWGGPYNTLRKCLSVLPMVFACFILAHFAGKAFGFKAIVASLAVLLLVRGGSSMMIVSSNLCINNVVPQRNALGSINGMSQAMASLARAIGPIAANSGYAFSITALGNVLDGQSIWIVLCLISFLTWFISAKMEVPRRAAWRTAQ